MDYICYIFHCDDIIYKYDKKIGMSQNWLDRNGAFITAMPRTRPVLEFIIKCDSRDDALLIEAILHDYYILYNNSKNANTGGTEWFNFEPKGIAINSFDNKCITYDELKNILAENMLYNDIIYGDSLAEYSASLERTIRDREHKNSQELNERIAEHKLKLAQLRASQSAEQRSAEPKSTSQCPYKLRGYQIEAFEYIQNSNDSRLFLEVFCGGGKTIIYQKVFYELPAEYNCFILIVPSITLMSDMRKRWAELIDMKKWESLYISSECHKSATTDKEIIEHRILCEKLFVCVTIKSFKLTAPILKKFSAIYLVGDEAHNLCDSEMSKKSDSPLRGLNETPEHAANIKKMLFATATPKTGDYVSIKNDAIVHNNIKYFGQQVRLVGGSANLRRLRAENFLCPYEVIMGEVDINDLEKVYGNFTTAQMTQLMNYKAAAKLTKCLILREPARYKKILMYTTAIGTTSCSPDGHLGVRDFVKVIREELSEMTRIGIFFADSKRSGANNLAAVKDFENIDGKYDATILVNCRMFKEGINIPSLDTVVFCDPKQSISEIIQIFGRPLRNDAANPNKKAAIIVPYLVNMEYTDETKYKKILDIINTISTQDEFLRDELKSRNDFDDAGHKDKYNILKHVKLDITTKVSKISDFKANAILFDYLKQQICHKCATLEEAIITILGDYIPRLAWQIFAEIKSWDLLGHSPDISFSELVCAQTCGDMLAAKKISIIGDQYFIEKPKVIISRGEFIKSLASKNIFTETQYRKIFGALCYPENYPPVPSIIYPEIWELLILESKAPIYTFDECKKVLKENEAEILALFNGFKTESEKNEILCEWDNRIPLDMNLTYKKYMKELYEMNEKIFDTGLNELD